MAQSIARPAYLRLLRRASGVSGEALREAMGRKWRPTMFQLRPIAERLGYDVVSAVSAKDGLLRYRFINPSV